MNKYYLKYEINLFFNIMKNNIKFDCFFNKYKLIFK